MSNDGYVFEYRLFDAGRKPYVKNWDKAKKQPKCMLDEKAVGFESRTLDQIRDSSQPGSPIPGESAVAFDPDTLQPRHLCGTGTRLLFAPLIHRKPLPYKTRNVAPGRVHFGVRQGSSDIRPR